MSLREILQQGVQNCKERLERRPYERIENSISIAASLGFTKEVFMWYKITDEIKAKLISEDLTVRRSRYFPWLTIVSWEETSNNKECSSEPHFKQNVKIGSNE